MQISRYLKDKLAIIVCGIGVYLVLLMLLAAFKVPAALKVAFTLVFWLFFIFTVCFDYVRKYHFYRDLMQNLHHLDQKYLVLETIERPDFYEGQLMTDILFEIDKSMVEKVKEYSMSVNDFKEYIEMWIHEVKIPISSLMLMCHNNRDTLDKKYISQIRRLNQDIDQVLYYVRAEHAEKDYQIKKNDLKKLLHKTVMNNKDDLLESGISIRLEEITETVVTDAKWLEFILNQFINNAVKYRRKNGEAYILIWTEMEGHNIVLHVKDNGMGIPAEDVERIFEKSFTGENGRKCAKSTGMGLYIARNLCRQLGHGIRVKSEAGEYTDMMIVFDGNEDM